MSKITPPKIVFDGGVSLIINQTQVVPRTLSIKKINATSWAGAYLGAIVKIINGIGKIIKHINNKINICELFKLKFTLNGSAYNAAITQPNKHAGTKSLFL